MTVTPGVNLNLLRVPPVLAVASFAFLLLCAFLHFASIKRTNGNKAYFNINPVDVGRSANEGNATLVAAVRGLDGSTICALKFLRVLGMLALLSVTIFQLAIEDQLQETFFLLAFYVYTAFLATGALLLKRKWRDIIARQLCALLFVAFVVYIVLDVWPLAIFERSPRDVPRNWLTWVRLGLLGITGVVIPVVMPRPFRPHASEDLPAPEDTASILSKVTFDFLDPIIFKAYRAPDLPIDALPPVPQTERAVILAKMAFPHLDPIMTGKKRHIMLGIIRVFARKYIYLCFCVFAHALSQFLGPFGLQNLLVYLENHNPSTGVRPWVWILTIAVAPMITAMIWNLYLFISSLLIVEGESVLTQLVFEHSLRIRMKADALDDKPPQTGVPDSTAPSSTSTTPGDAADATSVDESMRPLDAATGKDESTSPVGDHARGKGAHLIGKINNLVTSDLTQVVFMQDTLLIPSCVLQVLLSIAFLYSILGWSALAGLTIIIIGIPVSTYIGKLVMTVQVTKMGSTDQRVQTVTETMTVLRMVKLFAWETRILEKLTAKRDAELRWIRYGNLLQIVMSFTNETFPVLSMIGTFATYTLIMKQPFSASVAFTAISVFNILAEQMYMVMLYIPASIRGKVSYDRFNDFINKTKLLSDATLDSEEGLVPASHSDVVGFNAATFTWGQSDPKQFHLRFDDNVTFLQGSINLIIGPTAAGKTSLLMALLGEMYYMPHGPGSWYNLPREGGVAYAAQESWVLNKTIRDNILFDEPYDERRYNMVLKQCALERDLSLWEAGDLTEVGEKGLTLSGGQKARLTFARALYSHAQILLLDDILAALDVHTAKSMVEEAFKGDLIRGRTVLLVTHNVALASPLADHVVVLGRNGRVTSQGSISDVLKRDSALRAEIEKEQAEIEKSETILDKDAKEDTGKLIVPEEKALGRVEWTAIMLFVRGFGGSVVWLVFLALQWTTIMLTIGQNWFIGYWASQYESRPNEEVPVLRYLAVYVVILVVDLLASSLSDTVWVLRCVRASRTIHKRLLASIINAPLRWLDVVPIGRVITRCTQDMNTIDGQLIEVFCTLTHSTMKLVSLFVMTAVIAGWPAVFSGGAVALLGGWLGHVYLKAQLSIRREMSNAKSTVISQVAAALAGLPSIRAYGAQANFRIELAKKIDVYTRAALTFNNINRWISFRAAALGSIFSATITAYLVYVSGVQAGGVGFTLTMVLSFARNILNWVRVYNSAQIQSNSLERVLDFLRIPQEPAPDAKGKPPAYWPASGNLQVEGLSARYSADSPEVLRDISFEVKSGERIGVVGRTGAGKSTIALALLRAIPMSGKVYYDGLATDTLNLNALRSSLTLIPQQPELLRGTLRETLDPFSEYDDAALNEALRSAGMSAVEERDRRDDQQEYYGADERRSAVGLDSAVDSGGTNFSLGQRQIIALARAILRQSRLLILDEATAAIDYETDTAIQKSLRTELSKDTSVITIAHRLQTIMDSDKILVLEAGRLVEFDSPINLLRNKKGYLRSLVDESDDRQHLLSLAGS